ncbi:MAG: M28 family metallopeptidase [Treponema sp.]|nr:M28 family metallopeptidase [Treponema sp.]
MKSNSKQKKLTNFKSALSGNDWAKNIPYDRFFDFIAPNADRYNILLECINSLNLNSAVIPVAGNRHIFVFPSGQKPIRSGVFPFKNLSPYLFSAHYDRVEGSQGANDNSIAVFHLLSSALYFVQHNIDNWMIVFTDKEELEAGESLEAQGSFSLAEKLKLWGLGKAKVFNFDACGCGNVFVFSTTTDHILKSSELPNIKKVRNAIINLRDHALASALSLRLEKVLLAPTPFSDDAGFLRAGMAALTITTLPVKEAALYEALLRSRPDFTDSLISGKIKRPIEYRNLPETWRNLNNAKDIPSNLTPQYFDLVKQFVIELCK